MDNNFADVGGWPRTLGAGGFGTFFAARGGGAPVAVKLVPVMTLLPPVPERAQRTSSGGSSGSGSAGEASPGPHARARGGGGSGGSSPSAAAAAAHMSIASVRELRALQKEIAVLSSLRHPNVGGARMGARWRLIKQP